LETLQSPFLVTGRHHFGIRVLICYHLEYSRGIVKRNRGFSVLASGTF
jgi:hypothetical protein